MREYGNPGHDAEFLLQMQKAANDRELQAVRRGRGHMSASPVTATFAVSKPDPVLQQAAARFVARAAAGHGPSGVEEILQMLGLEAS